MDKSDKSLVDSNLKISKVSESSVDESVVTVTFSSRVLLPSDKASWMEYVKYLAKEPSKLKSLDDECVKDPSLPVWYYWSKEKIAEWLNDCGLSSLKEMFLINDIDGRKLGRVDASALQKMGVKYFPDVNSAMKRIRRMQGVRYPNSMRSHTQRLPYEEFLQFNWKRGKTYDLYTFQQFCLEKGYYFDGSIKPPLTTSFSCPVSISIRSPDNLQVNSDDSFGSKSSLDYAPTVEIVVRTVIIRNKIIDEILNELLKAAFSNKVEDHMNVNLQLKHSLHCKLSAAYEELGIENTELCALDQLNFATTVAKEFLNEILKTKDLLENIEELQLSIEQTVPSEVFEEFAKITKEFLAKVAPTAALLGLMKLDLDLLLLTKKVSKIEKSMYPQPEMICIDNPDYNEE